jgi:hypothetical protein
MKFERAQKKKQKLKIALAGISGSGKTYSALTLAFSMCTKVCVIDTECGSASLYSDHFPAYDVLELSAPYSPTRYIEAISMAEKSGYECIIIDSLSHEWNGAGGCLDMVTQIGGNSYTAWKKVTPLHDALIGRMISSQTHIIVTMRTKTAYEISTNDKGKQAPVKVGMAPTQRDGVEYEFTIVFDLDQKHRFTCSKDRTSIFSHCDIPQPLDDNVGKKILAWLDSGVEAKKEDVKKQEVKPDASQAQYDEAYKITLDFRDRALKLKALAVSAKENPEITGESIENITQQWFALCDMFQFDHPGFKVPENISGVMGALLGLNQAAA